MIGAGIVLKKTEHGKEIAKERECVSYKHPWCGREFKIQRRFWEFEAYPQGCCIERCEKDVNNCEIAEKHWNENLTCPICSCEFPSKKELDEHMKEFGTDEKAHLTMFRNLIALADCPQTHRT